MKRWTRLLGFVGVIGVCVSTGLADWADSFDGGTFDLPTWQYLAYPQVPGVTQFGGTVVSGPDGMQGRIAPRGGGISPPPEPGARLGGARVQVCGLARPPRLHRAREACRRVGVLAGASSGRNR